MYNYKEVTILQIYTNITLSHNCKKYTSYKFMQRNTSLFVYAITFFQRDKNSQRYKSLRSSKSGRQYKGP